MEKQTFNLVLKDANEFGKVALAGYHRILEDDRDVSEILYHVEKDLFDRVFVYIKGLDSGSIDVCELQSLLLDLELGGADISTRNLAPKSEWEKVCNLLTYRQFQYATTDSKGHAVSNYQVLFERAYRISKKGSIKDLCLIGMKKALLIKAIA